MKGYYKGDWVYWVLSAIVAVGAVFLCFGILVLWPWRGA